MRILITGGAGFIGRRLIKKLSKIHDVIVFTDREASIPGAKVVVGDLMNDKDLEKLKATRFDVVYHLAAVLDESNPNLWEVNVEGTRRLLDVCKRRKIERFIFVSPIGVLGEATHPLKEDDPYNPDTLYEKSKAEAERLIMDYKLRWQVPYTIIRATIIYGPNHFWGQIVKAAKEKYPLIGEGDNFWHLVYVDDAVQSLVLALHPKARNQIYNIAGPDYLSYRDTYRILCKALRVRMTGETVHPQVAKAAALAHEVRSALNRKRPKVTMMRASIDRLIRNRVVDISKAKRELGYKPKYSLEKGFNKMVKELNE